MSVAEYTTKNINIESWVWVEEQGTSSSVASPLAPKKSKFDLLKPLRHWLEEVKVSDRHFAHAVCKLIPAQCPFERDFKLFGKVLFHIPPMCKLNPLYEEVVGLRFRALCYLADVCGEDISAYC